VYVANPRLSDRTLQALPEAGHVFEFLSNLVGAVAESITSTWRITAEAPIAPVE